MSELKEKKPLDFNKIREKLSGSKGKQYWRSLDELSDTPEFNKWMEDEFPNRESLRGVDRRDFLKFMGASVMMASLAGCRSVFTPQENVVPYVKSPEDMIPGQILYFATAVPIGGYGIGALVHSNMGRPIKIDGNPEHPASQGVLDPVSQAQILSLYDPDRSQNISLGGNISTWSRFLADAKKTIEDSKKASTTQNSEIIILTETNTSPTLIDQMKKALENNPKTYWCQYEPNGRDSIKYGSEKAFGKQVRTNYDLNKADVILSLDADFLYSMQPSAIMSKGYASRKKLQGKKVDANRLYVIEPSMTLTGANAEHRLPVEASKLLDITKLIAGKLGIPQGNPNLKIDGVDSRWIEALTKDLIKHQGKSAIIPGDHVDGRIHALAHAINAKLENIGKSILYTDSIETDFKQKSISLEQVSKKLKAGKIKGIFILGSNPIFTAPKEYELEKYFAKLDFTAHLGLYYDETARKCKWHLPESHFLEAWGDIRSYDGSVTIQQPLLSPLYSSSRSQLELISAAFNKEEKGYELVKKYWKTSRIEIGFDSYWTKALDRGIMKGTAFPAISPSLKEFSLASIGKKIPGEKKYNGDIQLDLRPDPNIYDGRYANNGWLQELPKPITKLTWDNTAQVSPKLAEKLGISNSDVIEIDAGSGKKVNLPVWIVPGQAEKTMTVHYGYGRKHAGMVGDNIGTDVFSLLGKEQISIKKISTNSYPLATTQMHQNMEGRDIIRTGTLASYIKDPSLKPKNAWAGELLNLYPEDIHSKEGNYQWAMTIDLNLCTGCNACVVACQSENNIPVVGKKEVVRGRVMHWMRIDTYFAGDGKRQALENPETVFQPVTCMHCEKAPCEPVCPVAATIHSHEGLNQMVYNRCVGTRYCSNNCPYKVRRFNYFNYADKKDFAVKLLVNNPRVTVRGRGVMEKCTYCVQRINNARIDAKKNGRKIKDGEIITACQQACPTDAIVFGDVSDKNSQVSKLKKEPRNYDLLEELNARPRTSYLGKVKNPNPEIEAI